MTNYDLNQFRYIRQEIEHITEELKRLECKMLSPRASVLSDIPKGPPSNDDQMANNLIKLERLRDRYGNMLEDLLEKQLAIEEAIQTLEPLERDLVRYRYIDGLDWKDIYSKIGYEQRQTFRIHKRAVEKLENFKI